MIDIHRFHTLYNRPFFTGTQQSSQNQGNFYKYIYICICTIYKGDGVTWKRQRPGLYLFGVSFYADSGSQAVSFMLQNLITKFDHGVWKMQLDLTEMNEKYDKADLTLRHPK